MRYFYIVFSGVHPVTRIVHLGRIAFPARVFPSMLRISDEAIPGILGIRYEGVIPTYIYEFRDEEDFENFIAGGEMDGLIRDALNPSN